MRRLFLMVAAMLLVVSACGEGSGAAPDELNVAYFAEWPSPNQFGQADGTFGDEVGTKINWVPFDNGNDMADAMDSGEIDISYAQGLTPFANAANVDSEVSIVGIAFSYSEADNCVVRKDLGITQDNIAEEIEGLKVMTTFGNITHYKMRRMMEHLEVDVSSFVAVQADSGADTAAAFVAGEVAIGCAFGGAVVEMLEAGGELIMTGAEQEAELGISTYDVVSMRDSFGEEYPDTVVSFLKATQKFNDDWAADPESRNPTIAEAAGMDDVGDFLAGEQWFGFPDLEEQLGDEWMGGTVANDMKGQLDFYVEIGDLAEAKEDFSQYVDSSYLEKASK